MNNIFAAGNCCKNMCRSSVCVSQMAEFFIAYEFVVKHFHFIKDEFYRFAEDPLSSISIAELSLLFLIWMSKNMQD